MPKDKPVATAKIRFYSNKHIDVELDTLHGVNPRMLSIAGNLLNKKYREMRNKHNADEHRKAHREAAEREREAAEDLAAFHIAEDERLRLEAEKDQTDTDTDDDTVNKEIDETTEKE